MAIMIDRRSWRSEGAQGKPARGQIRKSHMIYSRKYGCFLFWNFSD